MVEDVRLHDDLTTYAHSAAPALGVSVEALLTDGRRRRRRRHIATLSAGALTALALAGAGSAIAGMPRDEAPAIVSGQAEPAATSEIALPESQALNSVRAAFARDIAKVLPAGMTPLPGEYFTLGAVVQPYTFVVEQPAGPAPSRADQRLATAPVYIGRVWLSDRAGVGSVTLTMSTALAGTASNCDGATMPCTVQHRSDGATIVTVNQSKTFIVYVTKRDGTQLALTSSADVREGKGDSSTNSRPTPPLNIGQLTQIATDPTLTLWRQ
jgi:hypothetical protein